MSGKRVCRQHHVCSVSCRVPRELHWRRCEPMQAVCRLLWTYGLFQNADRCKRKKHGATCVTECPAFTFDRFGAVAVLLPLGLFILLLAGDCVDCHTQCAKGCIGPAASDCMDAECIAFLDEASGDCVAACKLGTYAAATTCMVSC